VAGAAASAPPAEATGPASAQTSGRAEAPAATRHGRRAAG